MGQGAERKLPDSGQLEPQGLCRPAEQSPEMVDVWNPDAAQRTQVPIGGSGFILSREECSCLGEQKLVAWFLLHEEETGGAGSWAERKEVILFHCQGSPEKLGSIRGFRALAYVYIERDRRALGP